MSSNADGDAGGHAEVDAPAASNPSGAPDSAAGFDSAGDASATEVPADVDPMEVEDEEVDDIRAAELLLRQTSRSAGAFDWKNIGASMASPAKPVRPATEEAAENDGGVASAMQPASAEPLAEPTPATKQPEETAPAPPALASVDASASVASIDMHAQPKSESPVTAAAETQDASAQDVSMMDAEPTSDGGESAVVEDEKNKSPPEQQAVETACEDAEGAAVMEDQVAEPASAAEATTTSPAEEPPKDDQPDHAGKKRQRSEEVAELGASNAGNSWGNDGQREESPTRQKPRGSSTSPVVDSAQGEEGGKEGNDMEGGASTLAPRTEEAKQPQADAILPEVLPKQAHVQPEIIFTPATIDPNPTSAETESAVKTPIPAFPSAYAEPTVQSRSATTPTREQPPTQDAEMPAEAPVAPPHPTEAAQSGRDDTPKVPPAKDEREGPAAGLRESSEASDRAAQQAELSAAAGVSAYAEEEGAVAPPTQPADASSSTSTGPTPTAPAPQAQIPEPTPAVTPAKPIADPSPGSVATPAAGLGTPAEADSGMRGGGRGLPKGFRKSKIDDNGKFHYIAPDGTICNSRKEVKQWDEANALEEGRFVEEVFEPPEDRAKFLSFVVLYLRKEKKHVEANSVVEKMNDIAQIDGKAVDFSDLFSKVRARGGSSRMNRRIWISVLQEMNLSNGSAEAVAIKNLYERYLRCCEDKNWDPKELEKAGESKKQIEKGMVTLLDLIESGVLQAGQELVYNKKDEDTKQIISSHVGILNPDGTIGVGRKKFKNPNKFVSSFGEAGKKKADGWREMFAGDKSLAQIKNAFAKNLNQSAKQGLLQPEKAFGSTLKLLQTQSEQDASQIREAERAAMNPPPKWISPEDDADSLQRGEGKVHPDLEAALVKLETAGPEELQSTMKKVLDAVKERQEWTQALSSSPEPLTRIARCWWKWFFKSSLPPPHGSWTLDKGLVPALAEELNPTKKRKMQKRGANASGITMANSKYNASNLPPGWRKEVRNVVMAFYNYISPDGQYFRNWAKAFEHYLLTANDEADVKQPTASEDQPQDDAAKAGSAAEVEAAAEGKEAGDKDGAKDEAMGVEGAEAPSAGRAAAEAADDLSSEKKDEMVLDDHAEGDAAMHDADAKHEGGGAGEMRMSQCTCCLGSKCEFVDFEELLGSSGLSQSRLQAPAYTIMALAFTVLLSNSCHSQPGGIERIGSHGPTLQILIESLAKDAPQPVRLTTLEVLLVIAQVINLRTAPGNRLLVALSEVLEVSSSMKRAFVELPVYIIARLAECPHNRQVLQENEASVLPTLLWLLQFPKSPSLLSAVLDTLERFSLCGPSLARRMQRTKGCVKVLVHLVGSRVDSNDQMARKISFRDRIKAARILLKIAEDPGGIASLQEHEHDLVDLLASSNQIPPGDQGDAEELRTILGSIMHAMVPTEAPYIKALENYDPLPSASAQ